MIKNSTEMYLKPAEQLSWTFCAVTIVTCGPIPTQLLGGAWRSRRNVFCILSACWSTRSATNVAKTKEPSGHLSVNGLGQLHHRYVSSFLPWSVLDLIRLVRSLNISSNLCRPEVKMKAWLRIVLC